jgi:hypothetical protein
MDELGAAFIFNEWTLERWNLRQAGKSFFYSVDTNIHFYIIFQEFYLKEISHRTHMRENSVNYGHKFIEYKSHSDERW